MTKGELKDLTDNLRFIDGKTIFFYGSLNVTN